VGVELLLNHEGVVALFRLVAKEGEVGGASLVVSLLTEVGNAVIKCFLCPCACGADRSVSSLLDDERVVVLFCDVRPEKNGAAVLKHVPVFLSQVGVEPLLGEEGPVAGSEDSAVVRFLPHERVVVLFAQVGIKVLLPGVCEGDSPSVGQVLPVVEGLISGKRITALFGKVSQVSKMSRTDNGVEAFLTSMGKSLFVCNLCVKDCFTSSPGSSVNTFFSEETKVSLVQSCDVSSVSAFNPFTGSMHKCKMPLTAEEGGVVNSANSDVMLASFFGNIELPFMQSSQVLRVATV